MVNALKDCPFFTKIPEIQNIKNDLIVLITTDQASFPVLIIPKNHMILCEKIQHLYSKDTLTIVEIPNTKDMPHLALEDEKFDEKNPTITYVGRFENDEKPVVLIRHKNPKNNNFNIKKMNFYTKTFTELEPCEDIRKFRGLEIHFKNP